MFTYLSSRVKPVHTWDVVAATATAAVAVNLINVDLSADAAHTNASASDRIHPGFKPVTRTKITYHCHHLFCDGRRHTMIGVTLCYFPNLPQQRTAHDNIGRERDASREVRHGVL